MTEKTKTQAEEERDDTLHKLGDDATLVRPPLGHGWYAIKAKPLAEARLVKDLVRLKLDTYRPMSTHYLRKRSGKVKVKRPIFAGYVFVCCSIADHYEAVRKLDGFGRFVHRAGTDNPFRFPDLKIGDLMMRQRFGEFDEEKPKEGQYQPKKGDRVLVVAGKWYGYFAEVLGIVSKKKQARVKFDEGGAEKDVQISQLAQEVA